MVRSNESKKIEAILQKKIAEKQVSNETQSVSVDSGSDERKKPPLLRLAALVRGGQSGTAVDIPSKVDRTKVSFFRRIVFLCGFGAMRDTSKRELATVVSRFLYVLDAVTWVCSEFARGICEMVCCLHVLHV